MSWPLRKDPGGKSFFWFVICSLLSFIHPAFVVVIVLIRILRFARLVCELAAASYRHLVASVFNSINYTPTEIITEASNICTSVHVSKSQLTNMEQTRREMAQNKE